MLTKLLTDLYIISLLDDEPNDVGGMSSAELKAKFDEAANTIKTYINETLIPELAGTGGADSVGIDTVPGLTGASTVQAALAKIEEQMAEMTQGAVADESITTAKLAALAVTSAKLAAAAVETDKIKDGAVTSVKLADFAVTAARLADLAVETAKIKDKAVTTEKIADKAVTTAQLGDASVGTAQLDALSVTAAKLAALAVETAKIKNGAVTGVKLADECKNIIRENVALATSAFSADSTIEGASYKAELAVTGSTAAMLPLIAWTAAQSEELEVKRIESAAGKVIIYSAYAPSTDLTIPTVALISPIGTGSSGASGGSGGGITGANGVTFTPHLSTDGTLSWTNDGGLTNPVPVNIKGAKGDTGAQGAKGNTGEKGEKGDTGPQGPQGVKGDTGPQGPAGAGDDTPDYVLTAADALAKKVVGHIGADNIVFAVMADAHLGYYTDTANAAGKQAGQALKRFNERSALDFVAHVGDYATGAWNTTADDTLEHNADYQLLIGSKFPGRAVWCPGNHDDAPYQATASRLTQTQMYAAIGRKNLASGGYVPNNACYGYMDFPGLHLRVIYLDTHDHRSWGTTQIGSGADNPYLNADNISAAQLQYLADHALNFSGVSDPSQWSILVFSHAALTGSGSYTDPVSGIVHPSNTANAATLLKAYATKQSGSITHGDSTVSYDFSTITPAQIIACIHGHEHRYANETVGGAFLSICCPNIMNGRERASADGNTYAKTAGTANGTSFCVFSINRTDKKIYVDHYGPGIDREFTYTVLDPDAPSYTNQLQLATDTDGSIYNGVGWAAGYRLNSSGTPDGYSGSYITGFIPAQFGDTVYLKNVTWQNGVSSGLNSGNQRISFYDANKNHLAQTNAIALAGALNGIKDDSGIWTQFTLKNFSGGTLTNAAFFRLNCAGITSESIITVNEEIAEA